MKDASDRYLRDLSNRWRQATDERRRETVESVFRDMLVTLGPFSQREIDVFCRGVMVSALSTVMASISRPFENGEDVIGFVQLLACRAAVEAENARRA